MYKKIIILLIPLTFLILCIGTSIGSSDTSLIHIASIIGYKVLRIPLLKEINPNDVAIIWNLRLPRVFLAFLVGSSLSVSGAVVQSLLRNPLASPYTLGVSSGASLGVGFLIISGFSIPILGSLTLPLTGFLCGLLTVFIIIKFAYKVDNSMSTSTIILSGMVFSLFCSAILTTVTALYSEDIKSIALWEMGSFSMKGWSYVQMGIPFFIIGIIGVMRYCTEMDILSFGEDQAKSVGVDVNTIKTRLLIFSAILTGSAVALSGIIGFVDLIIPHLVRRIIGAKHKYVIPVCVILGGCFMVITDLVARIIIIPSELPVGAITALIGAPFFSYIYFNKAHGRK
ncbi:FecCD family ABC transporter permease [Clostridium beijerinckii]|uniref:FecCD family ABC transporter permease n=1 Tax=Clostridium beijerinckii TaxID=1520 RepID=UPI0014943C0E|nr:iron ABC transporter permease [Clostridium beijerinckii]NOW05362.1 iron complex transport system permease protein [Clostridium beijerinckii]NYC01496.1 iron complex transport system permease protein [Clostridium beijerinckii]